MANLKKIFYKYHNIDEDEIIWCIHCGKPRPQYHHIVKKSQGGKDEGQNIAPLCYNCHIHEHHNMNILTTEQIILDLNLNYPPF